MNLDENLGGNSSVNLAKNLKRNLDINLAENSSVNSKRNSSVNLSKNKSVNLNSKNPINIVIPIAASSFFYKENELLFPKIFTEICGQTMLEIFTQNITQIKNSRLIFIIKTSEVKRYFLDETIKLLAPNSQIISLDNETAGMAISALFAVDFVDNENELIICNLDQILDLDLNTAIAYFRDFDAGVISFDSLSPRYSFVRVNEQNLVLQSYEKKPISHHAIAGFYYFKQGSFFINACEKMILKDTQTDGKFYISPCLNELILQNKKVANFSIKKENYHTFYAPSKIAEFERVRGEFEKNSKKKREISREIKGKK